MKRNLSSINFYEVFKLWLEGSNYFRCFIRSTNFVFLKHYPDFQLSEVDFEPDEIYKKVSSLIKNYDLQKTLFLLDIPGEKVIKTSFFLQNFDNIKPIITFNNPLHPYSLIGNCDYISALLLYGEKLGHVDPEGYIFALDRDRFGNYDEEDYKKFFNNQYELKEDDLPPVEMLKALGFEKIVYIGLEEADCPGSLKEDVEAYLSYLMESKIEVCRERIQEECLNGKR
jgi:hypothetical protein